MWEKQYKIYDYLGSLKAVTEDDGTVLTRKSYLPYGEPLETELDPQSKGYIGKEKDKENNLGDHVVRKYDCQRIRLNKVKHSRKLLDSGLISNLIKLMVLQLKFIYLGLAI